MTCADGNKRIAATMCLYFLYKNNVLFKNGDKLIDDHTLVALTIMIAESNQEEKEMMVSVIMNCIKGWNWTTTSVDKVIWIPLYYTICQWICVDL